MLTFDLIMVMLLPAMSLASSEWNQETRDYVLEIHNDYRKGEGGCRMNKLVYDMELEAQARKWAEGCVYKHESIKGRGENLAWNSATDPEKDLIKSANQAWFDEKNLYSYGQRSCGSSCHYTQMVWGKTNKVGCYSQRCVPLQGAWHDAWYHVCFYTPMGNWNGEKPYEKSCPTPCLEGQTQDDGLCVGEGKLSKEECKDGDAQCAAWAKYDQCTVNPNYMEKNCMKSCKIC